MNAAIASRLLPWFARHGRHDLPWQRDPTPYRVWVSEVMLQQTQVETVTPYFARFMDRLPDVASLAAASEDEVLRLWSGLGYYARGRNLRGAAIAIVARHGGVLPDTREALEALPGIGRSTAGAIRSLAQGGREPILDGNVKRVLTRVFAVREAPGTVALTARLWQLADDCTPARQVAEYTQAIMDLGATVCTRARPGCVHCPLQDICQAHAQGLVDELPVRRVRAPRRQERTQMVFVVHRGRLLLQRRPPSGIWGGLWAPPEFTDARAARRWWRKQFGAASVRESRLPPLQHAFTHFDLRIEPWIVECRKLPDGQAEPDAHWHDLGTAATVGLPAPVAKLIEGIAHGKDRALRPAEARSGRPRARAVSG